MEKRNKEKTLAFQTGGRKKIPAQTLELPVAPILKKDPKIKGQKWAVVCFNLVGQPLKVHGFFKVRGVYQDEQKAYERSEFLIKKVDHLEHNFVAKVGEAYPITENEKYSIKTDEVAMNEAQKKYLEDKKKKEKANREELDDIENRREELVKDTESKPDYNSLTYYITQRVKLKSALDRKNQALKALDEAKKAYSGAVSEIRRLDAKHPSYRKKWVKKLEEARQKVGIKKAPQHSTRPKVPEVNNVVQVSSQEDLKKIIPQVSTVSGDLPPPINQDGVVEITLKPPKGFNKRPPPKKKDK